MLQNQSKYENDMYVTVSMYQNENKEKTGTDTSSETPPHINVNAVDPWWISQRQEKKMKKTSL